MKYLVIIISLLLMAAAFPARAAADDWDAYMAYNSLFYHLADQHFKSITCTVESSTLDDMVKQIAKQLAPYKKNVKLFAKLNGFSLHFTKKTGLKITRPEIDVIITSEKGLADPTKVKQGVSSIKTGFKQMLDGLALELSGLFKSYEMPRREDYQNVRVTKKHGRVTASYQKSGNDITETFSGTSLEFKETGPGGESHMQAEFKKTDKRKLLLKDARTTTKQPGGMLKTATSVTYQKVGPVRFPRKVVTQVEQKLKSSHQKGKVEITLKNCKAK